MKPTNHRLPAFVSAFVLAWIGLPPLSRAASCVPAPSGLTSWWRAEGSPSDSAGSNQGTLAGDAANGPGLVGQGFVFDGSGDALQLGTAASLQLQDFTIEAWVKRASASVVNSDGCGNGGLFSFGSSGYGFYLDANGHPFLTRVDVNATTVNAGITDTSFHHLAVTKAGTTVVFYIDGAGYPAPTYSTTYSFSTTAALGARGDNLNCGFYGTIDELSVYGRGLSAAEIQAIYSAGAAGKCTGPAPPFVYLHPSNQTVAVSGSVTFSVLAGPSPLAYQWRLNGTNNIPGATNGSLVLTNVQLNQAGSYAVVVSNALGAVTSSNAELAVFLGAPVITSHPTNRTVQVGSSTTFTVAASGSLPFSYQWRFNDAAVGGGTNASLTLTNIQYHQAGAYSVVVSNLAASVTSSNAVLTVNFPAANVRVPNTNIMGGAPLALPVVLEANGNENALSFSLTFSTARLSYNGVSSGSGAAGAALTVYTNNQITSGRLGVTINWPGTNTFAAGTQEVVRILFTSSVLTGGSSVPVPIIFGDIPIARQLTGPQEQLLAANYANGTVTVLPSVFEADAAPRTGGNQALASDDWQQIGRFVARLDTAIPGGEVQRADCAPQLLSGDGQMKVADWVQAGRFIAGLDPLNLSAGPTSEVAVVVATGGLRNLRVVGGNGVQDVPLAVAVELQAQGNENALGFSLNFNPTAFTYISSGLGGSALGATLLVNANQIGAGNLGMLLALPAGFAFAPGPREIARVFLRPRASGVGTNQITLGDLPLARGISDPGANDLAANFLADSVVVNPLPSLSIARAGTNVLLAWPGWAIGFNLQSPGNSLSSGIWTNVSVTLQTNGANINVALPASEAARYFRLIHP